MGDQGDSTLTYNFANMLDELGVVQVIVLLEKLLELLVYHWIILFIQIGHFEIADMLVDVRHSGLMGFVDEQC